jgi:hypothetical protein
MTHDQPTVDETTVHDDALRRPPDEPYEPIEAGSGGEPEQLPPRPRRRVLAPVPVALLVVLMTACGFVVGARVEKGQASSSSGTGGGPAAALAALRGTGQAGGTNPGSRAAPSGGAAGFPLGGRAGGGAGTAITVGEVSYVRGSTLFGTDSQGTTKKVSTSAASRLTRSVSTNVGGIHPGETVVVQGSAGSGGSIAASSVAISAGGSGGAAGGSTTPNTGKGGSAPQKALFGE